MSTTEASTKAPPDTTSPQPEPAASTVVDGPDGQSLPIEITLNQHPDDTSSSPTGQGPRSAVRAWPLALFGTEAASTGASALYAAAGTAGVLTAAGVAAGGGLVAAGVAAHRARKSKQAGAGGRVLRSSGHRATLGSTGTGRTGGRSGGRGPGLAGRGGRSGGGGRSSALGAVGSGTSTHHTSPRHSPTSRNGASSVPKQPSPLNSTGSRGGGSAGRGPLLGKSGTGAGSRGRDAAAGGRGGILRRLSQRLGGKSPGPGPATGPLSRSRGPNTEAKGGGRARSTLAAWTRRAARSGMRGVALTRRLGRQALESPAGQAVRERIRSVRRYLAKKGKAGVRYVLRSAAAKVAAGAAGAVALIPGLLLRTAAAAAGGVLRFLRLAPRTGAKWGLYFTRWGVLAATIVHRRLMRRAKDGWDKDTRPDVLTDFDEPGHTRPAPADEFGTDYFGGNLTSVFQRETEAVRDAYATYDPPMMLAVAAEYWGLPEGVSSVAEAVRQLAVNTADEYPADAKMADLVAQVYALLHQAVQKAQEIGPLFAKVHENDLRRHEEPRPGEHMWNILERRQDGGFDQRQPSHFVTVAQDVAHVYSRYEPGHMAQVAAEYEGVPAGIENIAAAISLLQVRSNERYPVDKAVVDAIADVHQLLMNAASAAQELMPNFRRLHAPDISRHEAPRNGEESEAMWDV